MGEGGTDRTFGQGPSDAGNSADDRVTPRGARRARPPSRALRASATSLTVCAPAAADAPSGGVAAHGEATSVRGQGAHGENVG